MRYFVLAAVLVVMVGGYTAYWFTLATATEEGIATWQEAARSDGVVLRHRGVAVGGYPFRLEVTLESPSLSFEEAGGTTTLSTDEAFAVAQPWQPDHILARSIGPLRIDWRPPAGAPAAAAEANEAEASLRIGADGRIDRGAIDLHAIRGESAAGAFSAARGQVHLRRLPPDAQESRAPAGGAGAPDAAVPPVYDAAIQIDLLQLPDGAAPPELGREVQDLDLYATLRGDWPAGPFPAALASWRDAGGVVDVTDLKLAWGPTTLASEGSITVDEAMRPLGAFTVRIGGYDRLLEIVGAARRIDGTQMALLKLLLDSMSRTDAQGNTSVQFPVSAQDGRLFLGPISLMAVPPLL